MNNNEIFNINSKKQENSTKSTSTPNLTSQFQNQPRIQRNCKQHNKPLQILHISSESYTYICESCAIFNQIYKPSLISSSELIQTSSINNHIQQINSYYSSLVYQSTTQDKIFKYEKVRQLENKLETVQRLIVEEIEQLVRKQFKYIKERVNNIFCHQKDNNLSGITSNYDQINSKKIQQLLKQQQNQIKLMQNIKLSSKIKIFQQKIQKLKQNINLKYQKVIDILPKHYKNNSNNNKQQYKNINCYLMNVMKDIRKMKEGIVNLNVDSKEEVNKSNNKQKKQAIQRIKTRNEQNLLDFSQFSIQYQYEHQKQQHQHQKQLQIPLITSKHISKASILTCQSQPQSSYLSNNISLTSSILLYSQQQQTHPKPSLLNFIYKPIPTIINSLSSLNSNINADHVNGLKKQSIMNNSKCFEHFEDKITKKCNINNSSNINNSIVRGAKQTSKKQSISINSNNKSIVNINRNK